MSNFLRIGPTKVVSGQGLPFEMRAPNRLTQHQIAHGREGSTVRERWMKET